MDRQTVSCSFMWRRNRVRQRVRRTLTTTEKGEGEHERSARPPERTICKHDDESDDCKNPIKLDCKQDKRDCDIGKRRYDVE